MTRYRKAIAALFAAVGSTISFLWGWDVTEADALGLVTTWGGVVMVFLFPNDAPAGEHPDPLISERGRPS